MKWVDYTGGAAHAAVPAPREPAGAL